MQRFEQFTAREIAVIGTALCRLPGAKENLSADDKDIAHQLIEETIIACAEAADNEGLVMNVTVEAV